MSFEEWKFITKLMLDFYSLGDEQKEQVFLMIDGLKWRQNEI